MILLLVCVIVVDQDPDFAAVAPLIDILVSLALQDIIDFCVT